MQTEFTCGIYTANLSTIEWCLKEKETIIGSIDLDGGYMTVDEESLRFSASELLEIAVLMNNIKRQYKQLNNG